MDRIAESELILDKRGAIYHIGARPEEMAETIIIVGDPDRVSMVSKHFDKIEFKTQHREFIMHTGFLGNKRLSVLSTGIGPDNIDIAINEIDALVNIDFETRTIKSSLRSVNIIRMGTSGALQENVEIDSFVAGTHGLGFDNVMHFYETTKTKEEGEILEAFKEHTNLTTGNVIPYIFTASEKLLKLFSNKYHHGITAACPGFYGPQGRILRLPVFYKGLIDKLTSFNYQQHHIANFEMESSAIYGLGNLLGHNCLSLNVIVANRVIKEFSKDGTKAVEKLIKHSLDIISGSDLE